jgi:hypothetical protein
VRVGFAARAAVVLLLALVPFRILDQGFRPTDDALRHAAKAVSGRAWSEVLVLRPGVTMDSHPGWHALLGAVHRATGAGARTLVPLSVVALLLALLLPAAFLLRRPEAWALALALFGTLEPRFVSRLASGRPFVLSAALLVALSLAWAAREGARVRARALAAAALAFGIVAWMHPSWHLFLLPVAACLLAREARLAAGLAAALGAGVVLAGLLYGHPLAFVEQSLRHTLLAMGSPAPPGTLAIEFLPGDGSPLLVLLVALVLGWRLLRGEPVSPVLSTPLFALIGLGWLLGWTVVRFWSDWGAIALLAWLALELQRVVETSVPPDSRRRLALAGVAGVAALLVLPAQLRAPSRTPPERSFLPLAAPEAAAARPDPGGVLYTDDMRLFFQLYAALPDAPFRYVVGYEPALMPEDDLATFRAILAARTPASFAPWLRKMGPADRLVLQSTEGRPIIPELEWTQVSQTLWSGRVPRPAGR